MTEVHQPQGPLHTGDGNQYVDSTVVTYHFNNATRQAWDPRWMARDDLRWHLRRFAPPPNLGLARDRLHDHRTVLLSGLPGTGRRTSAKMLLNELIEPSAPFGFLIDEADRVSDRLSPQRVESRHRLLLDLSQSDKDTLQARWRELPAFRAVLQQRDAYLVVVLPDDTDHLIETDLVQYTARIVRPRADVVLRRHLEAEGIHLLSEDLSSEWLAPYLDGPMADIAALARSLIEISKADQEGSAASWLAEAIAAVSDRQRDVAKQVEQCPSGRERAVLLAAAMCEGSSADAVFFAAQRLLELLSLTAGEKPRLEQTGYLEQLKKLVIKFGVNQDVGFARYAYDRAVRKHFWDNYPDLRSSFAHWVGETLRIEDLTHPDREALVRRFIEQALRTGSADDMVTLIERWVDPTSHGGPSYWMQFGTQALISGLNDQQHGKRFRKLVYEWSRGTHLPGHVGQLLVHVCTAVIAPSFPEQALVRLHQRSRREAGDGDPTARTALLRLTSRRRRLFRLLLDRLVVGVRDSQWPSDLPLFVDVASPQRLAETSGGSHPLAADAHVRAQLSTGWHIVMTRRPGLAWPAIREWLRTAGHLRSPDLLLGILVDAVCQDIGLLGALYVVTRDWGYSEEGRLDVVGRMSQLIDAAQRVDVTDPTIHTTAEEVVR